MKKGGSGKLGGRPQLIGMDLNKLTDRKHAVSHTFVELTWMKNQQITSKLPVV